MLYLLVLLPSSNGEAVKMGGQSIFFSFLFEAQILHIRICVIL